VAVLVEFEFNPPGETDEYTRTPVSSTGAGAATFGAMTAVAVGPATCAPTAEPMAVAAHNSCVAAFLLAFISHLHRPLGGGRTVTTPTAGDRFQGELAEAHRYGS
jgi:hypothetical protein